MTTKPTPRDCEIFYWLVTDHNFTPERWRALVERLATEVNDRRHWHPRSVARYLAANEQLDQPAPLEEHHDTHQS